MSRMVCGRCGNVTAPNSTYCPIDRWTLFTDVPEAKTRRGAAIENVEMPRLGGFITRRRHESHRAHLHHQIHKILETRVEALEAELESDETNFAAHRMLGLLSLLDAHWERAHAHLERAHAINKHDCQTHINYAIVLAQRGKVLPALDILQSACQQWPKSPLVHYNLALVALQARRPELAINAIDGLEHLWFDNPDILLHYHDEALTVRGLASLQLDKFGEACAALEAVARHTPIPTREGTVADNKNTITIAAVSDEEASNPNARPVETTVMVLPEEFLASQKELAGDNGQDNAASNTTNLQESPNGKSVSVPSPQDLKPSLPPLAHEHHDANHHAVEATTGEHLLEWEKKTDEADLLNNLAIAEAAQGDIEQAIRHLGAALQIEPGHTGVLNNLGVLAYQQGYYDIALKFLEMTRQIEEFVHRPEPHTFNHLGVVLSGLGRLEESLEQFQHAVSQERAEFEVFYNLGRAYIEYGKPQKGVEYMRHAYQINPHHADVHTVLGAAYLLRGQQALMEEAMKYLKRALHLNHRHRIALADLAMTLLEMENEEAAQLVLHQGLKTHPKSTEILFLIAVTTMEKGTAEHWAEAGGQFNAILALRPDLTAARYNIALCQYMMGFMDAAALQLQDITTRDPSFAPAYYLIGTGHAIALRFKEALAAWQKALQFEPMNIDLHCNIAFVYYKHNNWKEAVRYFMSAHRIDPANAGVLGALGICFAQAARNERDRRESANLMNRAIRAFEQSLALNEHSPVTHSNLGLAYYILNHVEKSIDHWRIVSQLDSGYALRREEEQYRSYDDSIITLVPLNWRARIIRMAPPLPAPHTRLVPGYNARDFRPAISDPALREVPNLRFDLMRVEGMLAWMHLRQ